MIRRRKPEPIITEYQVEIILPDGKLLTVPLEIAATVEKAMTMAVNAERWEQDRRWFSPKDNQTEFTQGFYAGREFERRAIISQLQEGRND